MNETLVPTDVVGGTFWLLSIAMLVATYFFYVEGKTVAKRWKTSQALIGVVTLISAIQYFYLKDMWLATGAAPVILRYIDWVLSMPIQVVVFYFVLTAISTVSTALFWRLFIGALVMVIGQFLGAAGYMSATLAFLIGMVGWLYILGEVYMGEAGKVNAKDGSDITQRAFNSLRLIVTIGWAIYPLGYFIEYLGGGADINSLNVIYNLADFLNKIIFCLVVYRAAKKDTSLNH